MDLYKYYKEHKDNINSSIMEIAANLATARLKDTHNLLFEALVEPEDPDDSDSCTQLKEEYQDEFNRYYDEEYNRLANLMKFDYAEDDGIAKKIKPTNSMNFTSIQLQQTLRQLEATMPEATPQQRELLDKLHRDIEENGRFYEITSLTVPLMREHGYDVTEKDAGIINAIAEKVEIGPDILWGAVEVWANYYGIKQLENF